MPAELNRINSYDDFIRVVENTLATAWGKDWGRSMTYGTFVTAHPVGGEVNRVNTPIITHMLAEKRPAQLGSRTEIKPRVRDVIHDPNDPQHVTTVFGQQYDHVVVFSVWDTDAHKVGELAERFEEFMMIYTGLFKALGVKEIVYVRTTDELPGMAQGRPDLLSRHIYYEVRLDKTVSVLNETIHSVSVEIINLLGG